MGTINYKTSDYITIGLEPFDFEWYEDEDGTTDFEQRNFDMEDELLGIQNLLKKYNFHYYHVKIEPGYYEGFSIDIENNFGIAYDGHEDKRAAQKEITQIKNFLLKCVDYGLVCVHPGWCTTYLNEDQSRNAIREAVREMRDEVRSIPTWRDYNRG